MQTESTHATMAMNVDLNMFRTQSALQNGLVDPMILVMGKKKKGMVLIALEDIGKNVFRVRNFEKKYNFT